MKLMGLGMGILMLALASQVYAGEDMGTVVLEMPEIRIVGTSPVGATGIAMDHYPGNVQILNQNKLGSGAQSIADSLNQYGGSININDTQGNPYAIDLNYRGFTASAVLGTPQGLSVFLDGMRVNEPFGDVVSWDLIPQIAIANLTLIPGSNPVYGLNTLGGAIAMNTKSGFAFPGGNAKISLGSFGRRSLDVEQGGHTESTDYYIAASTYDDRGWAQYNPSRVRQMFAKTGFQDEKNDIDLSFMFADNLMYGNQTVPLSMIANAAQGYTHPDYTSTQNYSLNLRASHELDETHSIAGNVYYRNIIRTIFNSNLNGPVPSSDNTSGCAASSLGCAASNLMAGYTQNAYGTNVQWSDIGKLWGKPQSLTVGLNAEYGITQFSNIGQVAYVDATNATVGAAPFQPQASVQSYNRRLGIFATETLELSDHLTVTPAARYDYASLQLAGTSCTDPNNLCNNAATVSPITGADTLASVSGYHVYQRLNPSLGMTYKLQSNLTSFANYAEGFRTPSALELACANPNAPCTGVPNAFGADPNLKAVISKTIEFGFRGTLDEQRLHWRTAFFHSELFNDILYNQTNATQGYFSNVGQTLRQGIEASIDGKFNQFDFGLDASWVSASFQTPFTIANGNNSSCIAMNGAGNGCTGVVAQPGDKIPSIPALTLKFNLAYTLTPQTKLSGALQLQSSQYARGDENNQDLNGKVPGFATVKVSFDHQVDKALELYGGINNLFNQQYATFGILSANNLTTGAAEQFRSVGVPRSLYLGALAKF